MSRRRKKRERAIEQKSSFNRLKKLIKPKTHGQELYFDSIKEKDITLCCGPAGTGKSLIPVYEACKHLVRNDFEKIILTRPAIEAGNQRMGFLPGTADKKLYPYLIPLIEGFKDILGKESFNKLKHEGKIEVVPIAFMRGRNFHNSFIICDEAENATYDELKLLITRIGMRSKMVISGDFRQSDIEDGLDTDFEYIFNKLRNLDRVGCVKLTNADIVRNKIIEDILRALGE